MISYEEVRFYFRYNPDTGELRRVKRLTRWGIVDCDFLYYLPNSTGYINVGFNKKTYKLHRLVFLYMTGEFPAKGVEVDHINLNRLDNKWSNLRLVTLQENLRNKGNYKNNTSGKKGVSYHKNTGKWMAQLNNRGKKVYLGVFESIEEAEAARKIGEIQYGYVTEEGERK